MLCFKQDTYTGDESCKNKVPNDYMDRDTKHRKKIQDFRGSISDTEHHKISL